MGVISHGNTACPAHGYVVLHGALHIYQSIFRDGKESDIWLKILRIPDNHPFPYYTLQRLPNLKLQIHWLQKALKFFYTLGYYCTCAPQYGESHCLINIYWNEQAHLLKQMRSLNLKGNEYVGFHQFEVLPVPLSYYVHQWQSPNCVCGSFVTIWNKPWQNLLSFSLASHGLDVLNKVGYSLKHSNKMCVFVLSSDFTRFLNDFISPI